MLESDAAAHLAAGRVAEARAALEGMLDAQEVALYLDYRANLREALVLERLGQPTEAAALYRQAFQEDVLRAVQVLRILSVHPDRDALVAEAYGHVRSLVDALERGEEPVIYVTNAGEARPLRQITARQALSGQVQRYCYLPELVLTPDLELPDAITLDRCVVGRITAHGVRLDKLVVKGFVLGDLELGKVFEGARNKSRVRPASVVADLVLRDAVVLGRLGLSGVKAGPGRTYLPLGVFEGAVDLRGAELRGPFDARFASFGDDVSFRDLRLHEEALLAGARFRRDATLTGLSSQRDVVLASATFEGRADLSGWEVSRGVTLEDARFLGPVTLASSEVAHRLQLSRAVFHQEASLDQLTVGGIDALGTTFFGRLVVTDCLVRGSVRFSLDRHTRDTFHRHVDGLLPLYRTYQGDEDADAPLTTTSSYGVRSPDDLTAVIQGDVSFANTVFDSWSGFEGVTFGLPGQGGVASFYNARFRGESHFERTTWHHVADFTTIFGEEVAFNEATFHRSLILDDANVPGRVTLTDATFEGDATWSFYGAEISSFQVFTEQFTRPDGRHRLFYERCALGLPLDERDLRLARLQDAGVAPADLQPACHAIVVDELVGLKQSFGDRAMTTEEDDAWWWLRHHDMMSRIRFGSPAQRLVALVVEGLIFQTCFGWGVRLGNLFFAMVAITLGFTFLYRAFCGSTVLQFDGTNIPLREVSFLGLWYISIQSVIAVNTGWDFGDDDHRFRFLNTLQTVIGVILLTFFVGAYTRMILA